MSCRSDYRGRGGNRNRGCGGNPYNRGGNSYRGGGNRGSGQSKTIHGQPLILPDIQ